VTRAVACATKRQFRVFARRKGTEPGEAYVPESAHLGVTCSRRVTEARRSHARSRAELWGATFVERDGLPLARILAGLDALLVFEPSQIRLVDHAANICFHPGMAYQRIKRLSQGLTDPLVEAAKLHRGQRILDATLGFGQDALVAATVVGPTGSVTGLEASPILSAFADEGLPTCALPPGKDLDVAKVLTVHHAEATSWLATHHERFDVALLDPMFLRPKRAHPSFATLRRHALHAPLTDALIVAALSRATTAVAKLGHQAALAALSTRPHAVHRTRSATWATFTR
jgi:16S rRNA (guanine1516-N2)-methyltransferase